MGIKSELNRTRNPLCRTSRSAYWCVWERVGPDTRHPTQSSPGSEHPLASIARPTQPSPRRQRYPHRGPRCSWREDVRVSPIHPHHHQPHRRWGGGCSKKVAPEAPLSPRGPDSPGSRDTRAGSVGRVVFGAGGRVENAPRSPRRGHPGRESRRFPPHGPNPSRCLQRFRIGRCRQSCCTPDPFPAPACQGRRRRKIPPLEAEKQLAGRPRRRRLCETGL